MGREDGKPAFDPFPRRKNKFNIEGPIGTLSDIKLIRTDTTLDHSQKAEKQRKKKENFGEKLGLELVPFLLGALSSFACGSPSLPFFPFLCLFSFFYPTFVLFFSWLIFEI